jgi:hypothetical protein
VNQPHKSVETSIRKAFELLIQIRGHRQASRLLALANAYLRTLILAEQDCVPIVVSIRTVKIREP